MENSKELNNCSSYPLISILIPYRNSEKCIRKCVDSVLKQSYGNLEILLLDNGSSDKGPAICEEMSSKDNRIVLADLAKPGLSAARNELIRLARGEWLFFADSDDEVLPEAIEYLWTCACKNEADMVCGSFLYRRADKSKERLLPDSIMGSREDIHKFFLTTGKNFNHAWGKLYRKDLFVGLSYPEGSWYEDIVLLPKLIEKCDIVVTVSDMIYIYNHNLDSISDTEDISIHYDGLKARLNNISFYQKCYPKLTPDAIVCTNEFLFFVLGKSRRCKNKKEVNAALKTYLKEIPKPSDSRLFIKIIRFFSNIFPRIMGILFGIYSGIRN